MALRESLGDLARLLCLRRAGTDRITKYSSHTIPGNAVHRPHVTTRGAQVFQPYHTLGHETPPDMPLGLPRNLGSLEEQQLSLSTSFPPYPSIPVSSQHDKVPADQDAGLDLRANLPEGPPWSSLQVSRNVYSVATTQLQQLSPEKSLRICEPCHRSTQKD